MRPTMSSPHPPACCWSRMSRPIDPVEHHQLRVESARRAGLRLANALLQTVDQVEVGRCAGNHCDLTGAAADRRVAHAREDVSWRSQTIVALIYMTHLVVLWDLVTRSVGWWG